MYRVAVVVGVVVVVDVVVVVVVVVVVGVEVGSDVVVIFVCFFFDGSMSLIMLLLKRFDDWRLLDVSRNVVVEILRLILIGGKVILEDDRPFKGEESHPHAPKLPCAQEGRGSNHAPPR